MVATREEINRRQRELYAQNAEHRRALQKKYNERDAEKISERRKRAYAADPEKFKNKSLWQRHRMSRNEYEELLDVQGHRCAVCGSAEPGGKSVLFHVDHNHACCGASRSCVKCRRGLLCGNCDVGIGMLHDSAGILRRSAEYLDRYS